MSREMAERTTILRCLVGSQSYGLNLGVSDRDEKGVCVEDYEDFVALGKGFEQIEHRTAQDRTGDQYAKSAAGDLDLTIYSLRKFLTLALNGNPSITELLFNREPIIRTSLGAELQGLYPYLISKRCANAYLGYMTKQKLDMETRGRKDLIEKHGYDIKAASHLIRLGFQGCEVLETGKITLPIAPFARSVCLEIKQGLWKLSDVQALSVGLEFRIKDLKTRDCIQDDPQIGVVESWMRETYWKVWEQRRALSGYIRVEEPEHVQ